MSEDESAFYVGNCRLKDPYMVNLIRSACESIFELGVTCCYDSLRIDPIPQQRKPHHCLSSLQKAVERDESEMLISDVVLEPSTRRLLYNIPVMKENGENDGSYAPGQSGTFYSTDWQTSALEPPLDRLFSEYVRSGSVRELSAQLLDLIATRLAEHSGTLDVAIIGQVKSLCASLSSTLGLISEHWLMRGALVLAQALLVSRTCFSPRQLVHELAGEVRLRCGRIKRTERAQVTLRAASAYYMAVHPMPLQVCLFDGSCEPIGPQGEFGALHGDLPVVDGAARYRFIHIREIAMRDCFTLQALDIAHTFVSHVDTRELGALEELDTSNTRIRRLDLRWQRALRVLVVEHARIDFLWLPSALALRRLSTAFAGQIKVNLCVAPQELRISGTEALCCAAHEGHAELAETMLEAQPAGATACRYVVCWPAAPPPGARLEAMLPEGCSELVTDNVLACSAARFSTQDFYSPRQPGARNVELANLQRLEALDLSFFRCMRLRVAGLARLKTIKLYVVVRGSAVLSDLPELRVLNARDSEISDFTLLNVPALAELDLGNSNVRLQGLRELCKLQVLRPNSQEIIARVRGLYNLAIIDISDAEIEVITLQLMEPLREIHAQRLEAHRLEISHLPALRAIDADYARVDTVEISNAAQLESLVANAMECHDFTLADAPALERLLLGGNDIFIHNIAEFECLVELRTGSSALSALVSAAPNELRCLDISGSGAETLDLTKLTGLRELDIHNTNIQQLDLEALPQLTSVTVDAGCRISNCACDVQRCD